MDSIRRFLSSGFANLSGQQKLIKQGFDQQLYFQEGVVVKKLGGGVAGRLIVVVWAKICRARSRTPVVNNSRIW
jgi:hypothetical protein